MNLSEMYKDKSSALEHSWADKQQPVTMLYRANDCNDEAAEPVSIVPLRIINSHRPTTGESSYILVALNKSTGLVEEFTFDGFAPRSLKDA